MAHQTQRDGSTDEAAEQTPKALAAAAEDLTDADVDVNAGTVATDPYAHLVWAVPAVDAAFDALEPGARVVWMDAVMTVEAVGSDVSSVEGRHVAFEEKDAPVHERLVRSWLAAPIRFAITDVPGGAPEADVVRPVEITPSGGMVVPEAERPAFATDAE